MKARLAFKNVYLKKNVDYIELMLDHIGLPRGPTCKFYWHL